MSLLVLRYHRARAGRRGNPTRLLNAHFAYIAYCCANRMPGEPLAPGMTNVCLNFDDGYYDFYSRVYPLLIRHELRALLAIAPHFVREYVDNKPGDRLALEADAAFADPARGGFCTWSELEEMCASGHVTIAAHGNTRCPLDQPDTDLQGEVHAPQDILSARLSRPVDSFVFPDGRTSPQTLRSARQRYRYVFGNGGASNRDWNQPVIYRINADGMSSPTAPFSPARRARYRTRYWWNRLCGH
jgi:peptidoglycan/xylan/chitin deacetylase (PgdA/CDA1 family)